MTASSALPLPPTPARDDASETTLSISGMTCAACVRRVERALGAVPGVGTAAVNLATERATVLAPPTVTRDMLEEAVRRAGYDVLAPPAPDADAAAADAAETEARALAVRRLGRRVAVAAALTLPLWVVEMGAHAVPAWHRALGQALPPAVLGPVSFVLATLVLVGPGRAFFTGAVAALRARTPDMNVLVALGTLAAWGYSSVATFAPHWLPADAVHVYYEAAATIVTLVLVGKWIEARARTRSAGALRALLRLQPARARREGEASDVPVSALVPGDRVRIRPGERIPVDAVVEEGTSWVDEAMLTGEAVPVEKAPGDALTGGTLNGAGALVARVTRTGGATTLARIVRMVEDAQASRPPIQATADRVVAVFVPAVLVVAALAFVAHLVWAPAPALPSALVAAVSVLVVACPCAVGLATPVAMLAGTGRAASVGVLFRRTDAVEALARVRTVAFDKTGTLTLGRPSVVGLRAAPGVDAEAVLRLAAAVEAASEHPLARALVAAAGPDLPRATNVAATVGAGIAGDVEGHRVVVGSARHLAAVGAAPGPDLEGDAGADERGGAAPGEAPGASDRRGDAAETPVYVALDGRAVLRVAVADALRGDAAAAVAELQRQGLRTALVTGDTAAVAASVARRVGIDDVRAGVLPGGKADAVAALGAAHGPVAFVGDGLNDAPALARADVGVAVGTGTDVAVETADVVLMSDDVAAVVRARRVAAATLRVVRQNLFWAFAYNVVLIPVAAGAFAGLGLRLTPVLASLAMGLSSLFVVGNALRLRRA